MKKNEFLGELRKRLVGLPKDDLESRISFYEESINDRIDEGKTEDEAISEIGTVDEVIKQIASETSLVKLVKEKVKPRALLRTWEIVLIILGFPIWFPLLIVALTLLLVAYIMIWVFVIVACSIELALVGSTLSVLIGFITNLASGELWLTPLGLFIGGVGASILFFYICKYAIKVTISLSKKIVLKIKTNIINKENK